MIASPLTGSLSRKPLVIALFTVLLLVVLVVPTPATATELSADLAARRLRVMERLGRDGMLILWSAPERVYSGDVDYEYRQDSNLYYLTGITQPGTTLVLMPGNLTYREILFTQRRSAEREHWEGHVLSTDEASVHSGISTVLSASEFEPFIAAMLGRRGYGTVTAREAATFFDALAAGRGRVAVLLGAQTVSGPLTPPMEFARAIRDRFGGFQTVDATPLFSELRLIKTPFERKLLATSLEISKDAQLAGLLAARPGAHEYEVKAAIEAVHRARGAVSWAYPSITGSGPNATILHYPDSDRQMRAGELILVDAAANYQYMSGDITRTYPVSGTFSQAQKDIYQIVLQAQDEGIKAAKAGSSLNSIHDKTVEVIKAGLLKLGLITDASGAQYRMWYTHNACHYIGIDVHDVGERSHSLEPGMAFTIEPGIYIRQSVLDLLPRTVENLRLIESIQPAVKKYADIGVRIEDSFLLDEQGLRTLSAGLPRTIDEIETFMRKRK